MLLEAVSRSIWVPINIKKTASRSIWVPINIKKTASRSIWVPINIKMTAFLCQSKHMGTDANFFKTIKNPYGFLINIFMLHRSRSIWVPINIKKTHMLLDSSRSIWVPINIKNTASRSCLFYRLIIPKTAS